MGLVLSVLGFIGLEKFGWTGLRLQRPVPSLQLFGFAWCPFPVEGYMRLSRCRPECKVELDVHVLCCKFDATLPVIRLYTQQVEPLTLTPYALVAPLRKQAPSRCCFDSTFMIWVGPPNAAPSAAEPVIRLHTAIPLHQI